MPGPGLFRLSIVLPLCLFMAAPCLSPAHGGDEHGEQEEAQSARVLGEIDFPTSTASEAAQKAFTEGVLLLHLFEYPFARERFLQAQQLDPAFAMAYWGEAMTHNHPIWDRQNLAAARAALSKLGATPEERLSKAPTERERGFIASLELLYGTGTKAQRDIAYMRALEQLAARYPEDHEVQLFYALSLFGVNAGVRDTASYMISTAVAQGVFSENPNHPGAAHYLIHGVDDPVHAVLGLRAARALAAMAPDAGHSLHMSSHIFTAVGLWDDVVVANEAAVRVQNGMRQELGEPTRHWGHYNFWLLYGYLQQGRVERAGELLKSAYGEVSAGPSAAPDRLELDPDRSALGSLVQMWARFIIETRGWDSEVADWRFKPGDAFDPRLNISFVRALQAAHAGQLPKSRGHLAEFRRLRSELQQLIGDLEESSPTDLLYLDRLAVMEQELLASIEQAAGNPEAAIRLLQQASQMEGELPFSFGPPFVDLPSAEFLGDILLAAGRHSDAVAAYTLQLERSRLKPRALLGLSRAEAGMGNVTEARYAGDKLSLIWRNADPGVKELLAPSRGPEE
jgi:tetratricopeptide (TPR) repeat protein